MADVYTLSGRHEINGAELRQSLETVGAYRSATVEPHAHALGRVPAIAQPKWRAWRTRVGRDGELPEQFEELLAALSIFADPVLTGSTRRHLEPVKRHLELTALWLDTCSVSN
ncbi:hypothetical protein [Sinomonas albida]|uniref:hypothetical protein n=1 Tax=Sinomonas albida TaxID=369942 RepID=UPI0010A83EB3|nr:hypothetical protein [Sinomonas albida]